MKKHIVLFVLWVVGALFSGGVCYAQTLDKEVLANDSVRVLFVGNSYTYYNDMPLLVRSLASSSGDKLAVKMVTNGGWRLRQHAADSITLAAIAEGGWDYVVFQEQSKEPSNGREWVAEHTFPVVDRLDKYRRLHNPGGQTVFYMTWGYNNDTYEQMQQGVCETYIELTSHFGALCAPVGIAWRRIRTERPDITLYNPDNSHPSLEGSYLAANIFYTLLFQHPYTSNFTAELPTETAGYLQQIAQETVFANKELWGITQ